MKRRDFLKMAAFGFTSAGMPVVVNSKVVNDKRPNIILFLTDDQDKHSIGAYGGNVREWCFIKLLSAVRYVLRRVTAF